VKILAAIVTYNRKALLERCIDHIRAQTRPPDRLLVINNSSSDGTVEMLDAKGVDYVTQPNLGSAGGWARAIEEADAGKFDAVWLMDDDGYPGRAALERLEASLAPGIGCVSSVVLRENQPTHFVFPFPRLNRRGYPTLLARHRKIPTLAELRREAVGDLYPFAHLFNGALLSVATTRAIGNVSSNYFMSGDEVDYFMRLQRCGPVYSHVGALHYHPDVTVRPLTPPKFYYYLKNTIILNRLYFDRKTARHLGAIVAVLGRTVRRNSLGTALSYIAGRHAPVLWKAVARGLAGKLGPDFDG
jgi:rhamnopyranosyl-N-acetylglucosaminyl-diphospho-decaprenol beta-1,3/1,4-galactofuranosyltransferase